MTKINTHGVKYLGSKKKLLRHIQTTVAACQPTTALDVFTGTTRVAQMMRGMGIHVTTSDIMTYSRVFSHAWVSGQYDYARVEYLAGQLNRLGGTSGWFTRTYCDVQGANGGIVRFMKPFNGERVDAIRDRITTWLLQGNINDVEADVLVATLIMAMDKVDNTVGVQQAYLKQWCKRSSNALDLIVYKPMMGPVGAHIVDDVLQCALPSADIAYIDPPYNQHVYATNYHIWETIARRDTPDVVLKTNRRVDLCGGTAVTPWNRQDATPDSFRRLLSRLDVRDVIISYATGAHIELGHLVDIVAETRDIRGVQMVDVAENVMSSIGNGATHDDSKPERREWIIHATTRT